MSDEDYTSDQHDEHDECEETIGSPAGGPGFDPEDPMLDDPTLSENDGEPGDERDAVAHRSAASLNRHLVGTVTLHYPQRDVDVLLDGESAMRLLTMFKQRRRGGLGDQLDPDQSALAGWVVLDPEEVMAMSWYPSLGAPPRVAIDPPLPSTA